MLSQLVESYRSDLVNDVLDVICIVVCSHRSQMVQIDLQLSNLTFKLLFGILIISSCILFLKSLTDKASTGNVNK